MASNVLTEAENEGEVEVEDKLMLRMRLSLCGLGARKMGWVRICGILLYLYVLFTQPPE
jgi:hypothetical protein